MAVDCAGARERLLIARRRGMPICGSTGMTEMETRWCCALKLDQLARASERAPTRPERSWRRDQASAHVDEAGSRAQLSELAEACCARSKLRERDVALRTKRFSSRRRDCSFFARPPLVSAPGRASTPGTERPAEILGPGRDQRCSTADVADLGTTECLKEREIHGGYVFVLAFQGTDFHPGSDRVEVQDKSGWPAPGRCGRRCGGHAIAAAALLVDSDRALKVSVMPPEVLEDYRRVRRVVWRAGRRRTRAPWMRGRAASPGSGPSAVDTVDQEPAHPQFGLLS